VSSARAPRGDRGGLPAALGTAASTGGASASVLAHLDRPVPCGAAADQPP
jgi:hypothetical protein